MKIRMLILFFLFFTSCLVQDSKTIQRNQSSNRISSVKKNYGAIFKNNPIVSTQNENLSETINFNSVSMESVFISSAPYLEKDCTSNGVTIDNCYKNLKNPTARPLVNNSLKWLYDANTDDFLEVNTFGHTQKFLNKFLNNVSDHYNNVAYNRNSPLYQTSIPSQLFRNSGFWFSSSSNQTLTSYSNCDLENNAYYSPSENILCLGHDSNYPRVKIAQDNSVLYHELGHVAVELMLNFRNTTIGRTNINSDLGVSFYDEAGALNEGIADFFSFYMTKRNHFGEWGLGRFLNSSRPLNENNSQHINGISTDSDSRLSYPEYILYNSNQSYQEEETIHNGGQIISHYLNALTQDFVNRCSWTLENSLNFVIGILMETLSELGDLSSRGNDQNVFFNYINLDEDNAHEWIHKINPINFRKFSQKFAKYLYYATNISFPARNLSCNGQIYSKDQIESLLDDYGLLLFRTYNLNGDGRSRGHTGNNLDVSSINREKTILVKKDFLKVRNYDNEDSNAFIIDNIDDIQAAAQSLQQAGILDISSKIPDNFEYNNNNSAISPGEFVGVILNFYNASNSPIAGVHILANDWDHVKTQSQTLNGESITRGFPCNNLGDEFPSSIQEGAANLKIAPVEGRQGSCSYITQYNGKNSSLEPDEQLAPSCLVQIDSDNGTQWVQQDVLVDEIEFEEINCLKESSKKDCFVRVPKGADQAYISKINPNSSWSANFINSNNQLDINYSKPIFLEVHPSTPKGTKFLCRFRAHFTNCDDCYHKVGKDNDDYLDFQYSGASPFKIIHFPFTVGN